MAKRKLAWLIDPAGGAWLHVEPKPGEGEILAGRSARNIAAAFVRAWQQRPFDFAFVPLREPDSTGHDFGWMSPGYLQAVRVVDAAVGAIPDAVAGSGTAVIIAADHGGHGFHHREGLPEDRAIPCLVLLPGREVAEEIVEPVRIQDTAPPSRSFWGCPG